MAGVTASRWQAGVASALAGAGAVMRQIVIPAGRRAERHQHAHEQFLFVLSGAGVLQCEAGSIALDPGTALHLAAGAWHSAAFSADTVLLEFNLAS